MTNGASHPYNLDDSTFNYMGYQESPFVLLFASMKSTEGDGVFVTSHLVLFSFFLFTINARQAYMG